MGGDLYVVGQILAGNVTTHPLFPLEEGTSGKVIDLSFISDIIIPIDTKNQCPPRLHHYRNRDLSIK